MDPVSERLRARHPQRIDLSLERMRVLCAALGDPQHRLPPVIHVAGTNGKGSTVALIRAVAVWQTDDEVDEHYNALFRELLTYMMGDPRTIGACTHLLFMAKNLERIGDHATNIAETVHYEITGEDILGERPRAQPTAEDSDPTPNLQTH